MLLKVGLFVFLGVCVYVEVVVVRVGAAVTAGVCLSAAAAAAMRRGCLAAVQRMLVPQHEQIQLLNNSFCHSFLCLPLTCRGRYSVDDGLSIGTNSSGVSATTCCPCPMSSVATSTFPRPGRCSILTDAMLVAAGWGWSSSRN